MVSGDNECDELLNLHEFHPDRSLLGGRTTIDGCAIQPNVCASS